MIGNRQYGAWERFCSAGEVTSEVVRDVVAKSWIRCRGTGLHPRAPKAPVPLDAHGLASVLRRNQGYVEAAAPFMHSLPQSVREAGFIAVPTDASGVVLDMDGPADVVARAKVNNYVPGCCRAEQIAGTNAIALAIVERQPLQLAGAEHYNIRHHSWTCATAPVFGPDDTLLGTLTLSRESADVHAHTLALVSTVADAIRSRLQEKSLKAQIHGVECFTRSLVGWMSDPTITIDAAGEIQFINEKAERLLGAQHAKLIGQKLTSVFSGPQIRDVVAGKVDATPFEAACELRGRRAKLIVRPFVVRDDNSESIQGTILRLASREAPIAARRKLTQATRYTLDDIVGEHPDLRRQLELARTVASHDTRVLIGGETGTGKELLAQGIHMASRRAGGPFVALNCAAVPRELIESELLGFKDGAFTGAQRGGQIGKIELADGGTLFLDEVSLMPPDMQAKLLRVLQDGVVTRLGDTVPVQVDVRVIAATNENLYQKAEQGGFRADLYFRLAVIEITLPPLRERIDDIELLANVILRRLDARQSAGRTAKLSKEALALLRSYRWPGNVRELENSLEMALVLSDDGLICPEHFSSRIRDSAGREATPKTAAANAPRAPRTNAVETTLGEAGLELVRNALCEHNCNISKVSRALGISRSTVYRKMRQIGVNRAVSLK